MSAGSLYDQIAEAASNASVISLRAKLIAASARPEDSRQLVFPPTYAKVGHLCSPLRDDGTHEYVLIDSTQPWVYADEVASWGWDPATYRPGARTATEPSKTKLSGVAAAYWLAWESLPCFPNMPGRGTLGFEYRPKARAWTWTTWSVPLDIHAVGALLRRPEEGTALGGQQYRAGIVFAGQIQFFEPGRAT